MPNSSSQKLPWIIGISGLIACILSVLIASLRSVTIDLLYIAIISIFLSILLIFIESETRKTVFSKGRFRIIVLLCTYILLVIWLGLTKVIPEYVQITDFEKHRNDLVFHIMAGNKGDEEKLKLRLAKHNLSAPIVIKRNEPLVRYQGLKMMERLLTEKIEQNLGWRYKHDMFYLAEFAYQTFPDISKRWYINAYEAGRLDALERHEQRFEENFKDSEPGRFAALERYNRRMREKYENL